MEQDIKNKFLELVDSLKKYRRAELINPENESIIEELYTDPLEWEFILKTLLSPNTTLLIWRKGTGKSTIISRFQHEIRKNKDNLSLYVDVKTIFDKSREQIWVSWEYDWILNESESVKLMTYQNFLSEILNEIQSEIKKDVFSGRLSKLFSWSWLTKEQFTEEINKLKIDLNDAKYKDITAIKVIKLEKWSKIQTSSKNTLESGIWASGNGASASIKWIMDDKKAEEELSNEQYSTVLKRYFSIIDFMTKVKDLLRRVWIKRVFICLDDASEIEEDSLDIFMRTIVAPLNNLADEFYKFKIAFYPWRDRTPDIDRTKLDTIKLDYYDLYSSSWVDKVEENAINCTKRLIENRFKYFFGDSVDINDFFEVKKMTLDDYYKLIFQISANVPRVIGKILWYASRKSINSWLKITKSILQEAAKELYINEIECMLTKNEYIEFKRYDEQFSRQHLKKLIDEILQKAKENKKLIGSSEAEIFKTYTPNTAPSNYLFIPIEYESIVGTLEFNFFLTKYSQQKDRESRDISVYTINYWLCQKENIIVDEWSDRKFRTERLFDFTRIVNNWAKSSEEIVCSECDSVFDIDKFQVMESYGMLCLACHKWKCAVRKIVPSLPQVSSTIESIKLPEKAFLILNTLKIENWLDSKWIAEELDSSTYSIGAVTRKDRKLRTLNYISKNDLDNKFYITKLWIDTFFGK